MSADQGTVAVWIWRCEEGHECAISTAAMVQAVNEPRCERVIGHHGRTQNDRYAFPYYEGAPVMCGARLVNRVRPFAWAGPDTDTEP